MEKLLFINGCVRGAQSRTLALARCFLRAFGQRYPGLRINTVDLNGLRLQPLYEDTLEPGASIGVPVHEVMSELVFILSGTGLATCSGVEERLKPGDCHYCPKGHSHSLENDGAEDLVFYTVVPQQ